MERIILLKYFLNLLDTDLKVILLNHKNNYVEHLNDNVTKSFNFLVINLSVYIIILIVRIKLFSNL